MVPDFLPPTSVGARFLRLPFLFDFCPPLTLVGAPPFWSKPALLPSVSRSPLTEPADSCAAVHGGSLPFSSLFSPLVFMCVGERGWIDIGSSFVFFFVSPPTDTP